MFPIPLSATLKGGIEIHARLEEPLDELAVHAVAAPMNNAARDSIADTLRLHQAFGACGEDVVHGAEKSAERFRGVRVHLRDSQPKQRAPRVAFLARGDRVEKIL